MTEEWAPLRRIEWVPRVRLCRARGLRRGYDTPGQPLSDYEPCEVCGALVVGVETPDGTRGMVELTKLAGDPRRKSARLRLSGRW